MKAGSRTIDVTAVIDRQRLGPVHWRVLLICFALILIDGYDVLAVAFVAPVLREEWGFAPSALGLLFSSAVIGSALGPLVFGWFADRRGRRPVILAGTLWFGLFTLAATVSQNVWQLAGLRFVAGLGMGAIIAIVAAYVAEFAPRRIRATAIISVYLGILLGGALGALLAAQTLPGWGWKPIFLFGGIVPLVLTAFGLVLLPESPRFLALDPSRHPRLAVLLNRMDSSLAATTGDAFILTDEVQRKRAALRALFEGRLAAMTPLLWVVNVLTLLAFYFVVQWAPILLNQNGIAPERAALTTAAFQIFGIVAALSVMRWVDRAGFVPVPILFGLSIPVIAAIGLHNLSTFLAIVLVGAAGFCIAGIQMGVVATQSQVYPTPVRALGVGACFAAGRLGAVLGSALAGFLVALQFPLGVIFQLCGGLMAVGVLCGIPLVRLYRAQVGVGTQTFVAGSADATH